MHDVAADHGLFGPDSVTWRIHGDPSMVLGGLRALWIQALHPLAMAGVAAHSNYREDPWGRLARTGEWIATVTFGTTEQAEQAGAVLRSVHASLPPGVEPESGQPYRVDDPDLLAWVHATEVDSFLSTYRRSGGRLERGDADRYVEEMTASARLVGLDPATVPHSEADLADYLHDIRPQLRATRAARAAMLYGAAPAMPTWVQLATPARPAWTALVATACGLLPRWARRMYGLPGLPTTDLQAAISARLVRTALFGLPGAVRRNPAHRAALERLAA